MALSLGVTVGSRIKIGRSVVRVLEILSPDRVSLSVDGGHEVVITDLDKTEILPNVMVFCGVKHRTPDAHASRLAFDAPLSVRIERMA